MTECGSCPAFGYQCEYVAKVEAQAAEIEKLREALQRIQHFSPAHMWRAPDIQAITRAALGETK